VRAFKGSPRDGEFLEIENAKARAAMRGLFAFLLRGLVTSR